MIGFWIYRVVKKVRSNWYGRSFWPNACGSGNDPNVDDDLACVESSNFFDNNIHVENGSLILRRYVLLLLLLLLSPKINYMARIIILYTL
mmetsp:Transcript_20659/g.21029  ORF Transcript_20659/g.21029 Transcript_20659/m.21029 type:complete len:90 (+) Transcript_20659:928-1197(+)